MRVEDQHRFEVFGGGMDTYGFVVLKCLYCDWQFEYDTTENELRLADLIDRADEHPDCRR